MGRNLLPLCTASVWPTNSGRIVQRRAQVFSTRFSPLRLSVSILRTRLSTTYGPFLIERAIVPAPYFFRRRTMSLSLNFAFRVLSPLLICPHGEHGWRPPEDLPSPPPIGWSTGFIATPRTLGSRPSHRVRPAFPKATFSWSRLPTCPTTARQFTWKLRTSPDGSRSCA